MNNFNLNFKGVIFMFLFIDILFIILFLFIVYKCYLKGLFKIATFYIKLFLSFYIIFVLKNIENINIFNIHISQITNFIKNFSILLLNNIPFYIEKNSKLFFIEIIYSILCFLIIYFILSIFINILNYILNKIVGIKLLNKLGGIFIGIITGIIIIFILSYIISIILLIYNPTTAISTIYKSFFLKIFVSKNLSFILENKINIFI